MAHIVVIGAGLGGLPTAYELRHLLSAEHTVTLIADRANFTFIPGLVRVALGLSPLAHVQLDLCRLATRHRLDLVQSSVVAMDPDAKRITTADGQTIAYDYAAIATGASLAFDAIPGLGPHGGYSHSICTPDHALTARAAWQEFLQNPGPVVAGAMSGAGCFGPAYEFLLMAEWILRRKGLRGVATLTYVTPEPYVGHLGLGGLQGARELTGQLMQERGIEVITNAEIVAVEPDAVVLKDGRRLPQRYTMILPAFQGVEFVRNIPDLGDEQGFIPILPTQRHAKYPSIYALGVSVRLEQPETTPIPIGMPKSGEMTEAMGVAVAHNIAVELGAIAGPLQVPTLEALCFAEFGDTGIAYIAAPVLPDPVTGKRRYSYALRGRWVNWVKAAFERYFLWKMRLGVGLPWYESWGLRLLFGLSLLKPLPEDRGQLADLNA